MSKKTVDERLADRLARIGDEAEAGEDHQIGKPIPEGIKVTRGNVRSKVLQVRLNPDEYAAIERIARGRRLPPSTVAREALLQLIDDSPLQDPLTTLAALADRIKAIAVDLVNDYPHLSRSRGDKEADEQRQGAAQGLRKLLDDLDDGGQRSYSLPGD